MNINGVPVRTILLNVSLTQGADPALLSRSAAQNPGDTSTFQMVGLDSGTDRVTRPTFGINFFRISSEESGGLSSSNRRRVTVINGTTGELLLNIEPGEQFSIAGRAAENQSIIDAINSVETEDMTMTYETWVADQSLPASQSATNLDPDSDGIVNLLEYAYGSNPLLADSQLAPRVELTAEGPVFVYQRNKALPFDAFEVNLGGNLNGLAPVTQDESDPATDQGATELRRVPLPAIDGRGFASLRFILSSS